MKRLRRTLILSLAVFLLFFTFVPKAYYPINIEIRIKSVFGAFRGNHFHGGIDFSTFRKIGVPVRAIEDGYIFRLSNKFYGFGKAVYIKHKNFISVYGHLDRFEEKRLKLETLSKRLAKNFDGRYFGDYFFKGKMPFVKKGQIIAYSGETGAGPPHLHFETRDLNNNPINTFNIVKIEDSIPPRIGKFIIKPLKYYSLLNGELKPLIIKANNGKQPDIFYASGPFSITITAWDKYYKYDRTAIYGWKTYIDGKLLTQIRFDKIPFYEGHQIALIYDINRSSYKKDYFFYNAYPYYGKTLGKNTILPEELFNSLSSGKHTITIEAFDFWGNSVKKSVKFIKVPLKKIEIESIEKISPIKVEVRLKEPLLTPFVEIKGSEEKLFYKPSFNKNGENSIIVRIPRPFDGDKYTLRIKKCKYCAWTFKTFDITSKKTDGFALKKGTNWITIDSLKKGEWIFGNKKGPLNIGKNIIPIYNGILKIRVENNRYTFVFKKNGKRGIEKRILLLDDFVIVSNKAKKRAISVSDFFYRRIPPDFKEFFLVKKGEEKSLRYKDYDLFFDKNSLYKDFYFKISKNGIKYEPQLPPLSDSITITPDNFPFKKSVILKSKKPDYPFLKRVGLFRFNKNTGKWTPLKSNFTKTEIIAKIWLGGSYALLADESPPELKIYYPKNGRRYRNVWRAVAIIRDKGKGIDYHKTFFTINNKKVWAIYDPDKASMYYPIGKFVKRGKNILIATVYDYAGNRSEQKIVFYKR